MTFPSYSGVQPRCPPLVPAPVCAWCVPAKYAFLALVLCDPFRFFLSTVKLRPPPPSSPPPGAVSLVPPVGLINGILESMQNGWAGFARAPFFFWRQRFYFGHDLAMCVCVLRRRRPPRLLLNQELTIWVRLMVCGLYSYAHALFDAFDKGS